MKQISLTINGKDLFVDVYSKDNKEMVAITPICRAIGIDTPSQIAKLKGNPAFTPRDIPWHDSLGRSQDMVFLPVEEVGVWLCTINTKKVRADVAPILFAFQKHCQVELTAALRGDAGIARVEALEKQNADLQQQLVQVMSIMEQQSKDIQGLTNQVMCLGEALNYDRHHDHQNVHKVLRSFGGKILNAAKKDKEYLASLH